MPIDINNPVIRYHLIEAKKLAESSGSTGPLTIAQWETYLKLKGFIK